MKIDNHFDVIIIGAGAAGLICAMESGKRGKSVLLIDHSKKIGEKIRISGGGRCNITNLTTHTSTFISKNSKIMVSHLSKSIQYDFIKLVESHKIKFHEKKLGQLFCDESSRQIIDMLLAECEKSGVTLFKEKIVSNIFKNENSYSIDLGDTSYTSSSLVVSTGGLSVPKIGATKFGYDIAKKFGLEIIKPSAALVQLTFSDNIFKICKELTVISQDAIVSFGNTFFKVVILFTHR